jgi:NHLM bacteriocin system ABC transporter peptidase/ATP-binding protein
MSREGHHPVEDIEHVVAGRAQHLLDHFGDHRTAAADLPGLRSHHRPYRTPTMLQMEAVECGAASLGMILGYYGRWVSLSELRTACGVSRDGAKGPHIAAAGERFGLAVHPRRIALEALGDLEGPAILWWGFNHFVVFEGFVGGRAQVNDPATGRRRVAPDEVNGLYTGIALTFEPSESFARGGRRWRVVDGLTSRARPVASGLFVSIVAALLATTAALVTPLVTGLFVDEVLVSGHRGEAVILVAVIVAATAFNVAATYLQAWQLLRVQNALAVTGAARFLWHILRVPLGFFHVRRIADIARRMDDNTVVAQLLASQLAGILTNVVTAALFGVVMLIDAWPLALVVFALNVVNLLALRGVLRRRATANRALYSYRAALTATTYGGLRTIETLKATNSEADYFGRWAGQQARLVNGENELAPPSVVLGGVPPTVSALSVAAVIVLGGWLVLQGQLTLGGLVAFQSLAVSFAGPVQRAVNAAGILQDVGAQIRRIDDALEEPLDPSFRTEAPTRSASSPAKLVGSVELEAVTFGYGPLDPPLIDGLSLRIEPGTRVAVVGASGAGKSTLVGLITGVLRPWSGSVRFDGRTRDDVPRDLLAGSVAVVNQRGVLFEGSIIENLSLWDGTIPFESLRQAARAARIHEQITHRPGGYRTVIEEGGRNWSGGERQRLEIARALARDPTVLVLDEATSALDPVTELEVDEAIRERGITTVIVAHRLSTIRDADEIIVLDAGAIVERGDHQTLMAARGVYAELVGAGGDVGV